jgi:peroxiredoxin family protein
MDDGEGTLSIALLSGTDDKLSAAALLTAGAAALGRKVDILLQYWALDAFRAGNLTKDHGLAPEAGPDGAAAVRRLLASGGGQHWSTVLDQAKQLGEVRVHACSLSMDLLGLDRSDLDALVDDVEGVTAFMLAADGQLVFI